MRTSYSIVLAIAFVAVNVASCSEEKTTEKQTGKEPAAEHLNEKDQEEPEEKNETSYEKPIFPTEGVLTFSTSAEGVREYLFINVASSDFIYYSDKAPIGIKLNILEHFDSGLEVQFPGQSDVYMLKFSQDPDTNVPVVCINPDGSEQEFYSPLHTGCFHSEDFALALISAGPPIMYVYFNASYPLGVITGIDGGSTEIGQFNLTLPGGKKLMSVSELSENDIQATLANGETMQLSAVVR